MIERLNELYKKQETAGLDSDELQERNELRRLYLSAIRGQFKNTLDRVKFVEPEELEAERAKQRAEHEHHEHQCHGDCDCHCKH